jgi:transcriptional regulator with XRE-family HTH domain
MSQVDTRRNEIMTTTIVRKGINRKAAAAKQAKHAQRTPLPPRPAEIVSDGERVADNFDTLSLPELRQLARAQGWSTLDNVTKSQLVSALREHPGGAPADAQPLGTPKNVNGNRKESKVDNTKQSSVDPEQQIAARIKAARENGYSRKDIADASGLTQSVVWRMQAKASVKPLELDKITGALDRIESGQLEPTRRGRPRGATESGGGTKAALQSKLDKVHEVLSEVPMNSNKLTEYRNAITAALDVIDDNA